MAFGKDSISHQDSILIGFSFCKHLYFESCVLCGSFSEAETDFINIIFGNSAHYGDVDPFCIGSF